MKYPIDIEKILEDIENIVAKWPVKKNTSDVVNWMLQFDNEDFVLAHRILKNLNVIGPEELNSSLAISYSKLMRRARQKNINISLKNTLFAAIGGASKSGAMIAYNFRLINELSAANFLDDDSIRYIEEGLIENLVLVDDIIATGDQSAKELQDIAEMVIPHGVKNIFVLTAVGMKSGIKKVQDTELAEVFSAVEYDEIDTVRSLDSRFYEGLTFQQRKVLQDKFSKYEGFGYGGVGALIAFFYNTPNCTLPSVWGDRHGWVPLFPRVTGVTGIDKHYPKLDKAPSQPAEVVTPPVSSLTIFVEGKHDEIFFENLASKFNNFDVELFDCISIGPFYSKKLIQSLNRMAKSYVLVTDDDGEDNPHSRRVKQVVDSTKLVIMNNMMNYLMLDKVLEDEEFKQTFDAELVGSDPYLIAKHIEMRLIRRCPPSVRERNISIMVEKYLDVEKATELVQEIIAKSRQAASEPSANEIAPE